MVTRSWCNTALRAPFVFLAVASLLAAAVGLRTARAAASAQAAGDKTMLRVSPGRVGFALSADGEWKSFGLRGDRALVRGGGVMVFSEDANGARSTLADAASGATRSLLPQAIVPTHEGVRGGVRYPSSFPDDDNDGRVDEDPLDGADNDHDGAVDEDFAAAGDEMVVAVFGPAGDRTLSIRQECYAWSLAHIDAMAASSITVRNTGVTPRTGLRVGIAIEAEGHMSIGNAPQIESRRGGEGASPLGVQPVVLEGRGTALALLLLAPGASDGSRWDIEEDHSKIVATSPSLGDLAPDAEVTVYVALIALPDDDLKAARAIHAASRTLMGDGTARLIPPPVPVTTRPGALAGGATVERRVASGVDPFWNTPGKLQETLVVGSPNPFRDAIAIDYEVPERVVDEDGVEHELSGTPIATSVKVYNVAGRLVATLVETEHAPGHYRTGWTARDDEGESVASGVYYVKLQIGRRSVTQRLVQLK